MSAAPQNILIVRLSAIGDIVMASGLIPALKARFPHARISWLAEPVGASLLQHNPNLDEVILWPRQEWSSLLKQKRYLALYKTVRQFRRQLKAKGYDLVLDTQGLLKSALLARMTSAPRRIGLGSKEGGQWLMHETMPRHLNDMISSEYRDIAEYLGTAAEDFKMQLIAGDSNQLEAQALLTGAIAEQEFVALCPFTTRPQKHWIEDYWPQLVKLIQQKLHLPCVVLGGPDNQKDASRIFANLDQVHNFAGKTNLLQTSEIIAKSRLLIGVDTGITHMGIAHNVPTVAIFGSTRPYLKTPNKNAVVIYDDLPCAPCKRRPTCDNRFDCMQQITPARVLQTSQELILESPTH